MVPVKVKKKKPIMEDVLFFSNVLLNEELRECKTVILKPFLACRWLLNDAQYG